MGEYELLLPMCFMFLLGVMCMFGWRADARRIHTGDKEQLRAWEESMEASVRPAPFAELWCYWRIDRDGNPKPSFCDDPMGHPHVHLIRIPVPEDVQRCIAAVKDPPMCMVMNKFSRPEGECPKPTNETTAP